MYFPEWGSCYNSGREKYETSPSSENIEEAVCIYTCMQWMLINMIIICMFISFSPQCIVLFVAKSGKFHDALPIACSTVGADWFTSCV